MLYSIYIYSEIAEPILLVRRPAGLESAKKAISCGTAFAVICGFKLRLEKLVIRDT